MKKLYAPWRTQYTENTDKTKQESTDPKDCLFCTIIKDNKDEEHFVLHRFTHNYVMLNRFPYNAGHLLITPYKHTDSLEHATKKTRIELMELASSSTKIVKEILGAHGVNLGINLGKVAGAGIPSHFHMHVLPRWLGDTNFLPTIAETKQISVDLNKIYGQLKPIFDVLTIE